MGGMGRGDAAELRGAAMAGAVRAIAGAFVRRRDMGGRARGRDGIAGGVLWVMAGADWTGRGLAGRGAGRVPACQPAKRASS